MAQQPNMVLPVGHFARVNSGGFSPDGRMIATVSEDKTIKIWEAESGLLLLDITAGNEEIKSVCFSPDGKMIATASIDKTVKIWDVNTGTKLKTFNGHTDAVNSVCFSADGKLLLSASADKTVKLWDVNSGAMLKNLQHAHWMYSACFSPDGEKIAAACEDRKAYVWDTKSGRLLLLLEKNTEGVYAAGITSVCFSPDGKKIITASFDKTIKLWDSNSGQFLLKLSGHSSAVNTVCFSPGGKKILTASDDSTAKIRDAESGLVLAVLKGHSDRITSACFSPDGKKVLTTSVDNTAQIWNTATGKVHKILKGHVSGLFSVQFPRGQVKVESIFANKITQILDPEASRVFQNLKAHSTSISNSCFSPDGKKIITPVESYNGTKGNFKAIIRDVEGGRILYELKGHTGTISSVCFSPDGKLLLTGSFDGTAKIWDAGTGSLLTELKGSPEDMYIDKRITKARFSPDGKKIITGYYEGIARVWDAVSGSMLKELKKHSDFISDVCFSPDGKKMGTASADNTAKIWDANNYNLLFTLNKHSGYVMNIGFSPDAKQILTGSFDNTVKLWDAGTGLLQHDLKGDAGSVSAFFSGTGKDGDKWIYSVYIDNTIKKWDAKTGKCIYTFFALDSSDYMLQVPSGYYQCTPNASRLLHYVTKGLKAIGFDQLDTKYNRPDKILEETGNAHAAMIQTYRNAYYKRMKKLGIDTTSFRDGYSVPEADIMNRNTIAPGQKNETLSLHIKGIDSTYLLDRFNVWVNEVPVYGQRGISIRKNNSNSFDRTISIKLSQGENRIETSVINVNGTESYRAPMIVNYDPEITQKEMVYFIGIGIDQFADTRYNLQYSTKDIHDLSVKMKEKFGGNIIIDTLFNKNVTVSNIKALKKKLQQTTVNDKVIISYSGHGMLSKTYDYYLSTYPVKFDDPQQNGLPYDLLEDLLDSIPARKKLMLIDACHSGEVDKDEYRHTGINKAPLDSNHVISRGVIVTNTGNASKKIGLQNSFELMQDLFVNVGKSTGATIISAAAGTELALEKGDLKNGVFTYCVIEAMNEYHSMKISELKKTVAARVEALTEGMQKPTSRNEAISVNWNVW